MSTVQIANPQLDDAPTPRTRRWWQIPWSHAARWAAQQPRIVSTLDRQRLYDTVPLNPPYPDHIRELLLFLATATPIIPQHVPHDAVTMNSAGLVRDKATGRLHEFELVYPYDADRSPHGRSVTAPFGAEIFGRRVGDTVTWLAHDGPRSATIETLTYQPERSGHYDR